MKKFGSVLSNPPYQKDVKKEEGGTRVSVDLYPLFIDLASIIGENGSLVTPRNWTRKLDNPLARTILTTFNKISQFNADDTNFPTIHKNYPLNIISFNTELLDELMVDSYTVSRETTLWFPNKASKILFDRTQHLEKIDGGAKYVSKISHQQEYGLTYNTDSTMFDNPVKIYAKKRAGKQPDGEWTNVEKIEVEPFININLDKYNVVLRSRIIGRMPLFMKDVKSTYGNVYTQVLPPHHATGQTWAILQEFDKEEEALMFSKYMNSKVATLLCELDYSMLSFAQYVPRIVYEDLKNVDNVDAYLLNLFKLTEEEKKIVVEEFDNYGREDFNPSPLIR